MKFRYTLFATLFLVGFSLTAQKSLLWKIEGKGAKPAYLFGTFHIFPQEKFVIPPKVKAAMAECDVLTMELDMAPGTEAKMLSMAAMRDGKTLDQLLNAGELQSLDSALAVVGMNRIIFNNWKPLLISSVFYNQYMEGGVASFEFALQKIAIEDGMEVRGLETVERQMAVFDNIAYEDQAKDLIDMIRNRAKYDKLFDDMVQGYLEEDVDKLWQLSADEMDDLKQIEVFLNMRNTGWVPKMAEMMTRDAVFFAVGAGHLGGKQGLIQLLKDAGYKVTAVR